MTNFEKLKSIGYDISNIVNNITNPKVIANYKKLHPEDQDRVFEPMSEKDIEELAGKLYLLFSKKRGM